MRLRLFDRIRRLAHFRRPPAGTASGVSGAQGRHRRGRRRGPATAPDSPGFPGGPDSAGGPDPARGHAPASGEWSAPGGPPGEVAHTASPWPGSSPISEAPVGPATPAAPGGPAGPWADHRVSGTRRDGRGAGGALRGGQGADPRGARRCRRGRLGRGRQTGAGAPVARSAGTKRRSPPWRNPQQRACRIPGRMSWPGSRRASRASPTAPGDLPGGPAGRPRRPGCPT